MDRIQYPAYQVKSFGRVVEITENRVNAHSAYERCVGSDKELLLVQADGRAKSLRSSRRGE